MAIQDQIEATPPRYFALSGILLSVFSAYYFGLGVQEYKDRTEAAKYQLETNQKKLKETLDSTQNKAKFQEETEKIAQTFRMALDYLPKELDTQDILSKVYREARASGIELINFKPRSSRIQEFYEELPMDIQTRGTYSQLLTFLSNVSRIPRIINIKNIDIGNPQFKEGVPYMQLSGTLAGYRYVEGR